MGKPGPMSMAVCLIAAALTLGISLICLPAAELLPAQVDPGKRDSGESLVRTLPGSQDAMKFYGDMGVQIIKALPPPSPPESEESPKAKDVMKDWQAKIVEVNGDAYGKDVQSKIETTLGTENLKSVLDLLNVDKNFVYSAYALFIGFALFFGAVGIQAMGRWGSEEKTILPAKK